MSQLELSGSNAALRLNVFFPTHLDTYIAVDFTLSEIGFRDNHLSLISFFHKINIFFVGLIFSIFHN